MVRHVPPASLELLSAAFPGRQGHGAAPGVAAQQAHLPLLPERAAAEVGMLPSLLGAGPTFARARRVKKLAWELGYLPDKTKGNLASAEVVWEKGEGEEA